MQFCYGKKGQKENVWVKMYLDLRNHTEYYLKQQAGKKNVFVKEKNGF